jgi:PIN domain nuclease of toxin-antitoxin system
LTLWAVADTHTIVWYLYDDSRLSERARTVMESAELSGHQIGVSAITLAEIVYLAEKGRIQSEALGRALAALDKPETMMRELAFDRKVVAVMSTVDRNEVPYLPDRIIAATARLYEVPVISRDRQIRASTVETIW